MIDGACELDGLFVEPELMGRGIGRELVADVIARSEGATGSTSPPTPARSGFYEKLGFRPGRHGPDAFRRRAAHAPGHTFGSLRGTLPELRNL